MTRNYLLTLFSCILFCSQLNAQTYTLGAGALVNTTTTGTAAYPAPFNNIDQAEHQQYLILASELTALGATAGNITQLAYYMTVKNTNNAAKNTLTGYTIKLKQTAATSIAAYDMAGLTTVYGPTNYVPATTNAWNALALTTCFAWDGVSNILVDQCHVNTAANKAVAGAQTQYNNLGFSASICTGGAAVTCGTTTGTLYNSRPNMQITLAKKDAAATACNLTGTTILLNQMASINVTIQNNSCNVINTAQVGYNFNGNIVTETFTGPLAPGASTVYTFTTPAVPFVQGFVNPLKLWVSSPDGVLPDGNPANDTLYVNNCFVIDDPANNPTAYSGTDFWLGFMLNDDNSAVAQWLYLSTSSGSTNVTISTPQTAPPWSTTVAVNANSITAVNVPFSTGGIVMSTPTPNVVSKTGIHLVGSNSTPFTVSALSRMTATTDGYLGIPTSALDKDYIVATGIGLYASGVIGTTNLPAEILIIANAANTTATITLPAGVPAVGHAAGSTWTTPTLQAGQTYLIHSGVVGGAQTDLTGTKISGNNKIGVLEGTVCTNIGYVNGSTTAVQTGPGAGFSLCGYCDHTIEMAIPMNSWGKTYYFDNFTLKPNGTIIRVVSYDPTTTTCTYTAGATTTFTLSGVGAYKDLMVLTGSELKASKGVYAIQMCTGDACDDPSTLLTDPFITNIIPREQWGNSYTFMNSTLAFVNHYVNIIKSGNIGRVALDGAFIPNGSFTKIGTTNYYRNTQTVAAGAHTLIGDSAFTAIAYGYNSDDAYGYPASGASLGNILLPVGLVNFNVALDKSSVLTRWTTTSEINNNYFVVERSVDNGLSFVEASDHISGAGTSSVKRNYSFTDKNPGRGLVNYYRLKQVDFNGKIDYSNLQVVNVPNAAITNLSITPIPAKTNVNVSYNALEKGPVSADVYDVAGKRVMHREYNAEQEGYNSMQIDIQELEVGLYFLQLSNTDGDKTRTKLIKE